uniref:ATP synthase complex subunit 8 n=1 Tax=Stenopsocus metastictus TaxID=3074944 RepID=A0AAU7VAG9_9NEOP
MPQMNPIWWVTLSLMFLVVLLMTNCINYFYKNAQIPQPSVNLTSKKYFNWKW